MAQTLDFEQPAIGRKANLSVGPQGRGGSRDSRGRSVRGECPPDHKRGTEGWCYVPEDIAAALNARGVATARGGQRHAKSVANILERA
jgi:hypothetical protein